MKTCQQCDGKHYAKGYCKPHYMQISRNTFGKREPVAPIDPEDFWQFVKKELNLG